MLVVCTSVTILVDMIVERDSLVVLDMELNLLEVDTRVGASISTDGDRDLTRTLQDGAACCSEFNDSLGASFTEISTTAVIHDDSLRVSILQLLKHLGKHKHEQDSWLQQLAKEDAIDDTFHNDCKLTIQSNLKVYNYQTTIVVTLFALTSKELQKCLSAEESKTFCHRINSRFLHYAGLPSWPVSASCSLPADVWH